MPVNNFDVMKEMGARNGKLYLAPMSNVVRMNKVKAGVQVTIGVAGEMWLGLCNNKFCGGFILCDKEEFDRVKAELEATAAAPPPAQPPE